MSWILIIGLLIVIGLLTGILIGMLGIGGGVIFVPVLIFLLPYTEIHNLDVVHFAIANSLLAGAIASTTSGIKHFFNKNIDLGKAGYLIAGTVISSFISPFFVVKFDPMILQLILAVLLIVIAIKFLTEKKEQYHPKKLSWLKDLYLFPGGLAGGIISAFSGIGGGLLFVPLLYILYAVPYRKAIGSSSLVVAATMMTSAISFASQQPQFTQPDLTIGYLYLPAGLSLGIAAAVGSLTGIKFLNESKLKTVQKLFSILLIIAALKIVLGS